MQPQDHNSHDQCCDLSQPVLHLVIKMRGYIYIYYRSTTYINSKSWTWVIVCIDCLPHRIWWSVWLWRDEILIVCTVHQPPDVVGIDRMLSSWCRAADRLSITRCLSIKRSGQQQQICQQEQHSATQAHDRMHLIERQIGACSKVKTTVMRVVSFAATPPISWGVNKL